MYLDGISRHIEAYFEICYLLQFFSSKYRGSLIVILLLRVAQQEGWAAQSALVPILIRPDHSENLFQDHLRPFLLLFLGQESIK